MQPLYALFLLSSVTTGVNWQIAYYIGKLWTASSFVLCQISIFTPSAISVDRLLALLSGLRYRQVATVPRAHAIITCFWLIGISVGLIYFKNANIAYTVGFALTLFAAITSVFTYSTIFVKLRRLRFPVSPITQGQPNGRTAPLNRVRYKKSVSSAIWVQVELIIFYVPISVVVMLMTSNQTTASQIVIALRIAITFIYLNSSLNPIV